MDAYSKQIVHHAGEVGKPVTSCWAADVQVLAGQTRKLTKVRTRLPLAVTACSGRRRLALKIPASSVIEDLNFACESCDQSGDPTGRRFSWPLPLHAESS